MLIYAEEIAGAKDTQEDRIFRSNVCGPVDASPFRAEEITVENTGGHVVYFRPRCPLCAVSHTGGIPLQPGKSFTLRWCHAHETAAVHGCREWGGVRLWGVPGKAFSAVVIATGRFHEGMRA
jgi:hypothetical protein